MERIARLDAVDADASRQMIEILKRQHFNDAIPADLPAGHTRRPQDRQHHEDPP